MAIFKEDLKVLEGKLDKISFAQCNSTGGTTTGTGDASAANQVLQITALNNLLTELEQKLENSISLSDGQLVADPTISFKVLAVYNQVANTTTYTRLDTGATIAATDFEPLTSSTGDTYELETKYDDNNDPTLNTITNIYAQYKTDADGIRSFVRYYEEDTITPYIPIGNILDDIGEAAQTNLVALQLTANTTFTISANMQSVQVDMVTIGDVANPPTITTFADPADPTTAIVKPLRKDRVIGGNINEGAIQLSPGVVITSTHPDDIIDIYYTTDIKL